jgi:hypothetical protein
MAIPFKKEGGKGQRGKRERGLGTFKINWGSAISPKRGGEGGGRNLKSEIEKNA